MTRTAQAFLQACEEKGMQYKSHGELDRGGYQVVFAIAGLYGNHYDIVFRFHPDEVQMSVLVEDLLQFDAALCPQVLQRVNYLNRQYQWFKFYIGKGNDTVTMSADTFLTPETAASLCFEWLTCCNDVADFAYSELSETLGS